MDGWTDWGGWVGGGGRLMRVSGTHPSRRALYGMNGGGRGCLYLARENENPSGCGMKVQWEDRQVESRGIPGAEHASESAMTHDSLLMRHSVPPCPAVSRTVPLFQPEENEVDRMSCWFGGTIG